MVESPLRPLVYQNCARDRRHEWPPSLDLSSLYTARPEAGTLRHISRHCVVVLQVVNPIELGTAGGRGSCMMIIHMQLNTHVTAFLSFIFNFLILIPIGTSACKASTHKKGSQFEKLLHHHRLHRRRQHHRCHHRRHHRNRLGSGIGPLDSSWPLGPLRS